MKIYIVAAVVLISLLIFSFKIYAENSLLKEANWQILQANKELNASLTTLIKMNNVEKELLKQKYELDLNHTQKIQKVRSYVKNSNENNITLLFNDAISSLQ